MIIRHEGHGHSTGRPGGGHPGTAVRTGAATSPSTSTGPRPQHSEFGLMTKFRAMGTEVWVHEGSTDRVAAWFEHVEAVCSRFRPDSELCRLNRRSPGWESVSPLLHDVLQAAATARRITGGLVDPAIGAALEAWGYDRSFELVNDTEIEPGPVPTGSWTLGAGSVWRGRGTRLDLGGVAKGVEL